MILWQTLARRVYLALSDLRWWALLTIFLVHLVISYALFALAGENDLVSNPVNFLYYYMVTGTTVGYGDLSPQSTAGRLVAVIFVLPGGIAIFTAVLGKLVTGITTILRNRMRGLGDFGDRTNHIVVLGWQEITTLQTLRLLEAERPKDEPMAVLVAKDLTENPAAACVDFVRTERLADPEALSRAGAAGARSIIVRGSDDDETLAAVLIAEDCAPSAHIVAYFADDRTARMVKLRRPRIEAIGSLAEELLSRSARDPGSSEIAARLLSVSSSDTAFGLAVPQLETSLAYGAVFMNLKRHYGVTLVGILHDEGIDLNCHDDVRLSGGETLYYIAETRLEPGSVQWQTMGQAT